MCIVLIVIVIAILIFWHCLEQSRIGRAFAAIKADEHAAELSGISSVYYKMMSFLFSAFFAGLAGALFAHTANFISPTDFSWHKVVDALLYCVFDVTQDINRNGTTILLVEQNAKKALQIADYAYVMETGKIVLHGDAADVAANPQVTEAYLGGKK